jgi:hypothetical protein
MEREWMLKQVQHDECAMLRLDVDALTGLILSAARIHPIRIDINDPSSRRHRSVGGIPVFQGLSAGLDPVTPMHDGTALGYPLPAGRRFRFRLRPSLLIGAG